MYKFIYLFLLIFFINFLCFGDSIFDEISSGLSDKETSNKIYLLQNKYVRKPISASGYLAKIEKNILGEITLHLLNKKNYLEDDLINITVKIKNEYNKEVLRYYKIGDYIYFSGKLILISSIDKRIVIYDASVSKDSNIIISNGL